MAVDHTLYAQSLEIGETFDVRKFADLVACCDGDRLGDGMLGGVF